MHDLELNKLHPIPSWLEQRQSHYMFDACERAARGYSSNIARVHSLALLPGFAFMHGEIWKTCCDAAMHEMRISDDHDPQVGIRAAQLLDEREIRASEAKSHFFEANGNAAAIMSRITTTHAALNAYLQSMVIQAWSAFEVLATDLCKNLLDSNCASLGRPKEKDWKGKYGFRSSRKIQETYNFVFGLDTSKISPILDSPEIEALALVRNVLVHCAGKLDDEFIRRSKTIPQLAYFNGLGAEVPIQITATWVRTLIDPVIPIGYNLLNTVDRWVSANP